MCVADNIDTNGIIILYPQTAIDNVPRKDWSGNVAPNNLACWDFIGSYGDHADQHQGECYFNVYLNVNQVMTTNTDRYTNEGDCQHGQDNCKRIQGVKCKLKLKAQSIQSSSHPVAQSYN